MNGSVLQCFWNNHPPPMATSERFAVGVALLILTVISFILNAALGYLVWKSPVFDRLFRLYVVSLVTAALSYLLTNCSILIPTALFHVNFDDPYNTILTVFDVVGYLAQIFTTTLIAVDRFVLFYIIGVHHGVVYRRHPIVFCIPALPWTASILLTIHTNLIGCYVRTNPFTLTYTYECSECGLYEPILYYLNHALPIITFILYCAIYANILVTRQRLRTGENSRKRRDAVRLVIQCSLICVVQFISIGSFYLLPAVMNNSKLYLTMLISTLNSMANPCVMFGLQPRLRRVLFKLNHLNVSKAGVNTKVESRVVAVNSIAVNKTS
ncbi:hypothetical protein ANCCEY_01868 [Ancylostoma ceylanicum]|uniref:G-protein coupled receptors family 1 profile domain-containing protein n=2 Tax=Ancylostoma ceylanicum TaxID=53326 RepID=A0A0D6M998_9BILA|nr:hypothetical protein ANCCEY_01868 [Ancylostoma ceylanicum]EYC07734.1 hypothetical protein Y032_0069g366 [Ancylostoma ceylanicum]